MKLLSIRMPSSEVLQMIIHKFTRADLKVTQSFDLQSARKVLADPNEYTCPYHSKDPCTCQYVVLLISHTNKAPASLVVHGHDDRTHITLVQPDDNQLTDDETLMHIKDAIDKFEHFVLKNALQRTNQEFGQHQ